MTAHHDPGHFPPRCCHGCGCGEEQPPDEQFGTVFDSTRHWRYTLERQLQPALDAQGGLCTFICLNPSTADEHVEDPTVRRCMRYAQAWGYSTFVMLNLFAWRSTDPQQLYHCTDPIGRDNDDWIVRVTSAADMVVCAWGVHGALLDRGRTVLAALHAMGCQPHALHTTADSMPGHPLYLPADRQPYPLTKEEQ